MRPVLMEVKYTYPCKRRRCSVRDTDHDRSQTCVARTQKIRHIILCALGKALCVNAKVQKVRNRTRTGSTLGP
jgi:hypothetical protein